MDSVLLDIAGKLLGRIIQEYLHIIVENVLLDSQCGFTQGRSCVNMIFLQSRQLVKKAALVYTSVSTLSLMAASSVSSGLCIRAGRYLSILVIPRYGNQTVRVLSKFQ